MLEPPQFGGESQQHTHLPHTRPRICTQHPTLTYPFTHQPRHYLAIIVPDNYGEKAPLSWGGLWITGGSNTDGPPKVTDEDMLVAGAFAAGTGMVMGALFDVPNEHIIFKSDPLQKSRTEDAIIAYT